MNVFKQLRRTILIGAGAATLMTACNPEPDESDLYTFTGETIESFIQQDSALTAFNTILARVGFDKMMAAYGVYTCFAPINEGVYAYCDKLYNDEDAMIPHNGMRQPESGFGDYTSTVGEEKLAWLSDSLCLQIARFHLTPDNSYKKLVDMIDDNGVSVKTMLGYTFTCTSKSDSIVLNDVATILSSDNEVSNGIVHIIDNVIPRSNKYIADAMARDTFAVSPRFTIFSKALEVTKWSDSLLVTEKDHGDEPYSYIQLSREGASLGTLEYPTECRVGFTLFAETDEEMERNDIYSFEDLVAYANRVYGNASAWYDYLTENNLTVSTGDDYENPLNALNMFVAYHIVNASMPTNQLVYEKSGYDGTFWNFAPDATPHDYYETKLPHTLLKVWKPSNTNSQLCINRYQTFNSLTNEVGTPGTNHEVMRQGFQVDRTVGSSIEATNGWIHSIRNLDYQNPTYKGLLVYDRSVVREVLHERMRVNCTSLFPELITNGLRFDCPGNGNRMGLPKDYFDNIVLNQNEICFCYCTHGAWRAWQSDQLQFWGSFDFSFKLPPVPTGTYEIRVIYAPMSYGAFVQYYIGPSRSVATMRALGIPMDMTIEPTDPRIGWTNPEEEDDRGIATDIALHNRNYMRAPYSISTVSNDGRRPTTWTLETSGRVEGGSTVRQVLGREELKQGDENWMRIKLLSKKNTVPASIDFIELIPVDVVDNQQYAEDWY